MHAVGILYAQICEKLRMNVCNKTMMIVISKKDWVSTPSLFRLTLPGHQPNKENARLSAYLANALSSSTSMRGKFQVCSASMLFQRIQGLLEECLGVGRIVNAHALILDYECVIPHRICDLFGNR
jgi:hypothetical protein